MNPARQALLENDAADGAHLPLLAQHARGRVHARTAGTIPATLLDEPDNAPIECVRRIRDHIDERVRELLTELTETLPGLRQN